MRLYDDCEVKREEEEVKEELKSVVSIVPQSYMAIVRQSPVHPCMRRDSSDSGLELPRETLIAADLFGEFSCSVDSGRAIRPNQSIRCSEPDASVRTCH